MTVRTSGVSSKRRSSVSPLVMWPWRIIIPCFMRCHKPGLVIRWARAPQIRFMFMICHFYLLRWKILELSCFITALPSAQFLFWSKTRTLMHSYAAVVRHFWTLEDTLVGYMFNDLIWCGQEQDSGRSCLVLTRQRHLKIITQNTQTWCLLLLMSGKLNLLKSRRTTILVFSFLLIIK